MMSKLKLATCLTAMMVLASTTATWAQGTLRIGMTASDIPLTTGQTDNGGEGQRFLGFTAYDSLVNWDLTSATKPSDLVPGLDCGCERQDQVDFQIARWREIPRWQPAHR